MPCVVLLLTALACLPQAWADDEAEEPPAPKFRRKSATSDGPGVLTSVGFLAGPTVGRDDSIAPLEVMPYVLFDPHFIFADVRGFVSTEGQFGGNIGAGYRHLNESLGGWYGANAWVDIDQTSGETFSQLGLGLEAVWNRWEARSNFYLPVGDREQTLEQSAVDTRFIGNQLWFDRRTTFGNSLAGFDGEVGLSWPIEPFDLPVVVRGFVGGYNFAADTGDGVSGFRTRLESTINSSIITQVEYTTDDEYGQNLYAGVTIQFPWGGSHPSSNWKRNTPSPFRSVKRNYNVILDRQETLANNVVAMNPLTSQPYFFQHVDTQSGTGGNGTFESPYSTFNPATTGNPDIILVHGGSVLNETLVIPDDTRVLDMNGPLSIQTSNLGRLTLPTLSDTVLDAPRITGINGTAVTMGTNSELSGFIIDNITGDGIVGTDGSGVTLRDITFDDISGDAIRFSQVTEGTLTLTDLDIQNIGGRGMSVENLDGDLTVTRLTFDEVDGASIFLDGGSGDVVFNGTTTITGENSHVDLRNLEGSLAFADLRVTGNSSSPLVSLTNLDGETEFGALVLENTNGAGLVADQVELLTVTDSLIETTNGPAVDISNSELAVKVSKLTVAGGPVGVRLQDVTGSVSILDGTIEDTAVAVDLHNVATVHLQSLELTDNDLGIRSRDAAYLRIDGLTVTGTAGWALDSMNDDLLAVTNSTFTNNGTLDEGTLRVQADKAELFRSDFVNNVISDSKGTALQFLTTSTGAGATLSTNISDNQILVSRGGQSAIRINWNGEVGTAINGNTIQLDGATMTAIDIQASATNENLSATISGNDIILNGTSGIGIDVAANGTSGITIATNEITANKTGNTGFRFQFDKATDTWIYSNNFIDDGGGATGMRFINVANLSRVQIEDNLLDLQSGSSSVDRGIRFDDLGADVEFFGNYDNSVLGATDPIFIPTGKGIGGFYVNGVLKP